MTLRDADGAAVAVVRTGPDGRYLIADLLPGTYLVCVAIPDGYSASPAGAGADGAADSDVAADGCTDAVTIAEGSERLDIDAGLVPVPAPTPSVTPTSTPEPSPSATPTSTPAPRPSATQPDTPAPSPPATGGLPSTGSGLGLLPWGAAGTIVAGAALILLRRRAAD